MKTITYSSSQTALSCLRKYYLREVKELVSVGPKAQALDFGHAVHEELFHWHMHRQSRPIEDNLIDFMMFKYRETWADEDFTVLGLELEIDGPVINPITCEKSDTFWFRGKKDGLISFNGNLFVLEHKTASIIKNYIESLWADRQILHYCNYTEWTLNEPVRGVLYNILVKPYPTVKNLADWYAKESRFRREYLYFGPDDYDRASLTLFQICKMLDYCEETGQWIQNTKNCYAFNRPCEYLRICKSNDNPAVIDAYYEHRKPHEELTAKSQEDNDLL